MRYVDGFVLPVPKKNLEAYRGMAQKAGKVWRDHGALGGDQFIPGFEEAVVGMNPGDSKTTEVPAEKAFGRRMSPAISL